MTDINEMRLDVKVVDAPERQPGHPLTDEEYASRNGLACPACHKSGVTGFDGPADGDQPGFLIQPCRCTACRATWEEWYRLLGYDDLTVPPPWHV
ncbi:MAG TPA: hypothetical protein PKZ27_02840 [Rhodocyclaceae bacterium]|nr:hypothetical protein [Burkholderiaceae bacterium]HRP74502.1 hypothetical protein [Rhodocyclaceae bacterium]